MLGLLVIYFIGRSYYHLAHDHDKSRWGFAILGVITYYAGAFIGGIIIAIFLELAGTLDNLGNDLVLGLLALPFGILACVGLYYLLKRNWEGKTSKHEAIIEEIGKEA